MKHKKCDLWWLYHAQGKEAGDATDEQWNMACVALDACWSKPTKKSALRHAQRIANLTGHPIVVKAITKRRGGLLLKPHENQKKR